MTFDGLIFDLDGTLWDAGEAACIAWKEVVRTTFPGEPLPEDSDIFACMGYPEVKIYDHYRRLYGDKSEVIIRECLDRESELISKIGAKIFPDLKETLEELKKDYHLCIVSNCQEGYIEAFFEVSKLQNMFIDYECEGHTGLTKGENIQLVCKRNGIKNPLYIGDTVIDEAAANEAGCPFVHASYGFGTAHSPIKTIYKPSELPQILFQLKQEN